MFDVLKDLEDRLREIGFEDPKIDKLIVDVRKDWAGETCYISLEYEKRKARAERNQSIIRDHAAGERVELIARRYKLSKKQVYQILNG